MCRLYFLFVLFLVCLGRSPKAQTVGVIEISQEVYPGYTLFAPTINSSIYLIDECGQLINEWKTEKTPGMLAKIDNQGNLFHVGRTPSPEFSGGGIGGTLTGLNWNNTELYNINLAQNDFHQHHDFEILPNGNLLVLGWEFISFDTLKSLGRVTANEGGLWSESVREIELTSKTEYNVVWEWRLIDHVMQNINPSLPNYGPVDSLSHKININYTNGSPIAKDWLHCNSLDYNPELDQIIINCRNFGEFWIIDHSTTTEEAATGQGGLSGMGGDILYRWGNPAAYDSGVDTNRVFYGQHDAHWIPAGFPGAGKIRVFNNGLGRPEGPYSTIETIDPPLQGFTYEKVDLMAYGPVESEILYGMPAGNEFFYAQRISGSQQLANGNTLICIGTRGRFLEITKNKELSWFYVNPSGLEIATQGSAPPSGSNSVFQAIKYEVDYAGFEGKDLSPGEKIELEPIDNCSFVNNEELATENIHLFYDHQQKEIVIENKDNKSIALTIFDVQGKIVQRFFPQNTSIIRQTFHTQNTGIYIVQLTNENKLLQTVKIPIFYE